MLADQTSKLERALVTKLEARVNLELSETFAILYAHLDLIAGGSRDQWRHLMVNGDYVYTHLDKLRLELLKGITKARTCEYVADFIKRVETLTP
jgi:hypothetical protein